jgi:hypothetical protein
VHGRAGQPGAAIAARFQMGIDPLRQHILTPAVQPCRQRLMHNLTPHPIIARPCVCAQKTHKRARWWEPNGAQNRPTYLSDARLTTARLLEGVFVSLRVVPEGLAATGAAVEALTARLMAAHAGAVPLLAAVAPPAADPVSRRPRLGSAPTAASMGRWRLRAWKSWVVLVSGWLSLAAVTRPVMPRRRRI